MIKVKENKKKAKLLSNQFYNGLKKYTLKKGEHFPKVLLKDKGGKFWKIVRQSHDYYYLRQVLSLQVMQIRIHKFSVQSFNPKYKIVAKITSKKEIWKVLEGKRM